MATAAGAKAAIEATAPKGNGNTASQKGIDASKADQEREDRS